MPVLNFPYRLEKPIHGSSIGLSVYSNWRTIPVFLHELKRMDITIHKAKMHDQWTTMYLKADKPMERTKQLEKVLSGYAEIDNIPLYAQGLSTTTNIHVYNISTFPYTVIDFGCQDRTGLLCEILEFLSPFDIEVRGAYINTIGTIATNMFYVTRNGQRLDDAHIEYLSNMMLYELQNNTTSQQDTNSF